jgi:murein DD-endopeptidase MepM/ murein hydrolase activator NlpD
MRSNETIIAEFTGVAERLFIMKLMNRIRGNIDKRALGGTEGKTSGSGLPRGLYGGARFVRGRLLRFRRRSVILYVRGAAAARRAGRGFTEKARPAAAGLRDYISPRLSWAASTVRLAGIAAAVIIGSPIMGLASLASEKISKRFGILISDKACAGAAGGIVFAALATVCLLSLPISDRPETQDADTPALTAASDGAETDSESEETPETAPEAPAPAWELRIDGLPIVALASQAEAETVLERVKASYLNGGSELLEAEIKEDLQIAEAPAGSVAAQDISDADAAVSYILTGTKEPLVYTVQSGDTVWGITRANGISQNELVKSNPGLIPDRLKIGQQLNLYEIKPYLTIRTVEIASRIDPIEFPTNYQNSDELYKGQTQILVAGVKGARSTQTQITKENGIVVESVEIGSAVTAEPQAQTSLVGTKPLETFTGSGHLISPLTHIEISSGFGSRGKRRHLGVDMRSPKGSPVYAADGGVVTTSSYQGSYGKVIVLNHGNGLETYYAHCDSLNVSVGDIVAQGQQIGTVGISGNATGYHLHFEVRVNGTYQNPLNYF